MLAQPGRDVLENLMEERGLAGGQFVVQLHPRGEQAVDRGEVCDLVQQARLADAARAGDRQVPIERARTRRQAERVVHLTEQGKAARETLVVHYGASVVVRIQDAPGSLELGHAADVLDAHRSARKR